MLNYVLFNSKWTMHVIFSLDYTSFEKENGFIGSGKKCFRDICRKLVSSVTGGNIK